MKNEKNIANNTAVKETKVQASAQATQVQAQAAQPAGLAAEPSNSTPIQVKGEPPDLCVVQPEVQIDGTTRFKSVGGLWHNVSKSGKEFYTLKIGKLKLLVFPNDREKFAQRKEAGNNSSANSQ